MVSIAPIKAAVKKVAQKGAKLASKVSSSKAGQKAASIFAKTPKVAKTAVKVGLGSVVVGGLIVGAIKLGKVLYDKFKGKDEDKVAKKPEPKKPLKKPEQEVYTVKKGDNVWNIAKKDLINKHKSDPNYKPSNAEIAKRTKEIIDKNGLHYEKDNYTVIIKPNDKLKL